MARLRWLAFFLGLPGAGWAARSIQPPPSGIVIHLFGKGANGPVQPEQSPGITLTAPKGATRVPLGFARALAKMLNNSGRQSSLTGRQAGLPPQAITQNERHPAQ
jgi:hypothetical protein